MPERTRKITTSPGLVALVVRRGTTRPGQLDVKRLEGLHLHGRTLDNASRGASLRFHHSFQLHPRATDPPCVWPCLAQALCQHRGAQCEAGDAHRAGLAQQRRHRSGLGIGFFSAEPRPCHTGRPVRARAGGARGCTRRDLARRELLRAVEAFRRSPGGRGTHPRLERSALPTLLLCVGGRGKLGGRGLPRNSVRRDRACTAGQVHRRC